MGLSSSSKTTSTSGPAAYTTPYVTKALDQTQNVVAANAGNLGAIGDAAIGAYNAVADNAFGQNAFLDNAKAGASTLAANANNSYAPFKINAPTIETGADSKIAGGQYLNRQPSASLYKDIIGGSQLNGNPYLQSVIDTTNASVASGANRQFASRGLGAGISTPYADVLSKNLAANEGGLRYQNYNDAANRQLTAAGQSDSAFNNERQLMDTASGRVLSAKTSNAANALAANAQGLTAQQAADRTRLDALGLTPGLVGSQFAGVDAANTLLNSAAEIPYTGVNVLGQNIANLTDATNTSTSKSKGPGLGYSVYTAAAGSAGSAASDRRLKTNIEQIDTLPDGLGVYRFDYIDPSRFGEGRQIGVMADEVAQLRPWALGPKIDGEYGSVVYSKLGAF